MLKSGQTLCTAGTTSELLSIAVGRGGWSTVALPLPLRLYDVRSVSLTVSTSISSVSSIASATTCDAHQRSSSSTHTGLERAKHGKPRLMSHRCSRCLKRRRPSASTTGWRQGSTSAPCEGLAAAHASASRRPLGLRPLAMQAADPAECGKSAKIRRAVVTVW